MVDCFALVGGPNARKTSTVRALTGAGRVQPSWLIDYGNFGQIDTYVFPAGLQEMRVSPADFIARVQAADVSRVIVALRHAPARGQPDAATYFRAFIAAGWNIPVHVVLGQLHLVQGPNGLVLPGFVLPNAPGAPCNQTAHTIRTHPLVQNTWGISKYPPAKPGAL